MLIGNPDKFAFLLEIVPEWSDDTFINGMLYVFINGAQYPCRSTSNKIENSHSI